VAHEIESIPAVIDLVRQGYGYAVLPLNAVKSTEWANQVEVRPVVSPTLKTSLSIATSTQRPRSSLMRKAILVIRDIVRQQLRSAEVVT
jgi:LysR family nitrogen assimilation transcriptional regulator